MAAHHHGFRSLAVTLFSLLSSATAFSLDGLSPDLGLVDEMEVEPRLFFANYTSGLLAVNSTILLYALAGAGVVAAGLLAIYLLANAPARSGYGSGYGSGYSGYSSDYDSQSRGFRTGRSGYDILTLISVATDLYGKLTYNDLDCQKKIICEFMDKPEMFGSGGTKVKTGVQYAASWLAPMGFKIVDQISEAAMLDAKQGSRNCEERFRACESISLKDTVAEKSEEVREVKKGLVSKEAEKAAEEEAKAEEYEYYYEDEEVVSK